MAHRAIQKQYNEWITKVYGNKGMTKEQRGEMQKAFFSGAFVMSNLMRELSEHPEDIAVSKLSLLNEELIDKIQEWCKEEK